MDGGYNREIELTKGLSASSPSQNHYIRQPLASLLMSRRDLVCAAACTYSKTCHCHVSSQRRTGRCTLSAGSPAAAPALKHCLRPGPQAAMRLNPLLNAFPASQQGVVQQQQWRVPQASHLPARNCIKPARVFLRSPKKLFH